MSSPVCDACSRNFPNSSIISSTPPISSRVSAARTSSVTTSRRPSSCGFLPLPPLRLLSIAAPISSTTDTRFPTTGMITQGFFPPKNFCIPSLFETPRAARAALRIVGSPPANDASASASEDFPPPYGPVQVKARC